MKYDPLGDHYKAQLANYALGGNFNSRLNLNLREDKAGPMVQAVASLQISIPVHSSSAPVSVAMQLTAP
jgi:hypothetical protein